MPRKRIGSRPTRRKVRDLAKLDPAVRAFLEYGPAGMDRPEAAHDPFVEFDLQGAKLARVWRTWRAPILEAWVVACPGTRPWAWWVLDAPELRRRVGGSGRAAHEVTNTAEAYEYGVPRAWLDRETADAIARYASDRSRAEEIRGAGVDPADPPRYESQAAYLRRLGLFAPGEARRVPADAYAPERIELAGESS